jgi:DNA polymerase III subunit delta'
MWRGIIGHDEIVEQFRRILSTGRLASTYLFVGPPGIGKRRFALELAHSLLCTENPDSALEPCGTCESCRMFAAGNHADLELVALKPDKAQLAISQFVGYDKELEQQGLCHRIVLKPFFGGRRIAIIDDADHFNRESANCLLKTLEEPPEHTLLILIGTSPSRQLPTIRSRSQIVRFSPLDIETVAKVLADTGAIEDKAIVQRAAELSGGSVERAIQLADPLMFQFRDQVLSSLGASRVEGVRLARAVQSFTDEAGKEASKRRERLRLIIGFAIEFYRARLGTQHSADVVLQALDASLTALEQIDRNANLGLVIQNWCEELARFSAHSTVAQCGTQPGLKTHESTLAR